MVQDSKSYYRYMNPSLGVEYQTRFYIYPLLHREAFYIFRHHNEISYKELMQGLIDIFVDKRRYIT
jgi:hypothetical protein